MAKTISGNERDSAYQLAYGKWLEAQANGDTKAAEKWHKQMQRLAQEGK